MRNTNEGENTTWVETADGTQLPLSSVSRFFVKESDGGWQLWLASYALPYSGALEADGGNVALLRDREYTTHDGARQALRRYMDTLVDFV